MDQSLNWRVALQEWLKSNTRTAPPKLEELHQQFLERFPKEELLEMTLEQYALGHDNSRDSFCYWLEWQTQALGSVRGGSAAKWGIWWSDSEGRWLYNQKFDSPEDALNKIKQGLQAMIEAVEQGRFSQLDSIGASQLGHNRNSLRAKPLYLYFPGEFLPIANPTHLANILRHFGIEPENGLHTRNRQLLAFLREQPEFDGFDTLQMMRFLYAYNLQQKAVLFQNQDALRTTIKYFARFANGPEYKPNEYEYKKKLLDGLNTALVQIIEGEAETAMATLRQVVKAEQWAINNLTSWQDTDNVSRYLQAVPAEQIQTHLQALLDEDGDLAERIDSFREAVETDFQTYLQQQNTIHLGFISLLLMAYAPKEYILYRASLIDTACEKWDAPLVTRGKKNDGTKYTQFLNLIPPLQAQLTKALDRPADLIDVYTLLWFNHDDYYDKFKVEPDEEQKIVQDRPFIRQLNQITQRTKNIILYGPPGTGKTYWAQQFGQRFGRRISFVTFHQSFAYEDFVEGLRPSSDENGQIRYDIKNGIFKRACQAAHQDPEQEHLLVIDEINRANIAKVFGELITLIEDDKRQGGENELAVILPYSGEEFSVPGNLFILGTMNTADRSIALLDLALRRRFTFVEVMPNPTLLQEVDDLKLSALLTQLNERIKALLDRDHQIGHSYLINVTSLAELRFAWQHRIVPLLEEYFYNDGKRLQALLGQRFIQSVHLNTETEQALGDWLDTDELHYTLRDLSDEEFIAALKELAGVSDGP
jgi:MoxR-like ATPase